MIPRIAASVTLHGVACGIAKATARDRIILQLPNVGVVA